jgi:hypothetical protein
MIAHNDDSGAASSLAAIFLDGRSQGKPQAGQ